MKFKVTTYAPRGVRYINIRKGPFFSYPVVLKLSFSNKEELEVFKYSLDNPEGKYQDLFDELYKLLGTS